MVRNNRTGQTQYMEREKANRYVAGQALIKGRIVENARLKDRYRFA